MPSPLDLAMAGIPAGIAGIDFIASRAQQGDPTSRAVINAAGGLSGLAASAALAAKLSGGNPLVTGLAGLAGYAAGGYGSDRIADAVAPEPEPAPMIVGAQPPFSQRVMLQAQLANLSEAQRRQQQQDEREKRQQAQVYLNQQMSLGQ